MLSAYHLTKNPILLQKADELGTVLLAAFNTPSGLPVFAIDSGSGNMIPMEWNGGFSLLAEIASCQMEFKYLAYLTDNPIYYEMASSYKQSKRRMGLIFFRWIESPLSWNNSRD